MRKEPVEYYIAPSMHDRDIYFLFCPGGDEKKFGLSEKGQVIEYKGNRLWSPEMKFIEKHFGL